MIPVRYRPCIIALLLAAALAAGEEPLLHPLFGDHAVLQRDRVLAVWGWTGPGEEAVLAIERDGQAAVRATVRADAAGRWQAAVGPLAVGGPCTLTVASGGRTARAEDVLVGEVWLCAGQSNMAWTLANSRDAAAEIAAADRPGIRHLTVPRQAANAPSARLAAAWAVSSPATVAGRSALAHAFALERSRRLGIPVGVIDASWGGTAAAPWTPAEVLADLAWNAPFLRAFRARVAAAPDRVERQPGPGTLFDGMVAPLVPAALAGVVWYQGESDVHNAWRYRTLLPAMITGWRARFAQPGLPFLIVQLAGYTARDAAPGDSRIAELRESQAVAAARLPACTLAVAIDTGQADGDIHPRDKRVLGRRLAVLAEGGACPAFRALRLDGRTAEVLLTRPGSALATTDGGAPLAFALAGADRVWHAARARLTAAGVALEADGVDAPLAVRYAWAGNPAVNLVDADGLPVAPFRSDDWPLTTQPAPEPAAP